MFYGEVNVELGMGIVPILCGGLRSTVARFPSCGLKTNKGICYGTIPACDKSGIHTVALSILIKVLT